MSTIIDILRTPEIPPSLWVKFLQKFKVDGDLVTCLETNKTAEIPLKNTHSYLQKVVMTFNKSSFLKDWNRSLQLEQSYKLKENWAAESVFGTIHVGLRKHCTAPEASLLWNLFAQMPAVTSNLLEDCFVDTFNLLQEEYKQKNQLWSPVLVANAIYYPLYQLADVLSTLAANPRYRSFNQLSPDMFTYFTRTLKWSDDRVKKAIVPHLKLFDRGEFSDSFCTARFDTANYYRLFYNAVNVFSLDALTSLSYAFIEAVDPDVVEHLRLKRKQLKVALKLNKAMSMANSSDSNTDAKVSPELITKLEETLQETTEKVAHNETAGNIDCSLLWPLGTKS